MTTLAAWRPATAYTKGATVSPNGTQGSVPVPILNGNFNSGDTAWTKDTGWAISTGDAYEGTHKGIYTGTGAGTIKVSGTYASTPGQVITATIKAKVLDATDGATAFLKWYDASNVLISTTTGLESSVETGVWMQLTVVGQAPANTATVVFGVEATRTVGANVMVDDARWDYAAPIVARRLAYRAVQDAAGVSGVVEPSWPTTLGARVNDGTVIWETVELDWIEWTARPILESGLTEPVWPTSVGGFVGDGTINWECTSRRVEDEKCPNTKVVCIINSKVFAADGDIVRYCATAMPLDWTTASDAGYLPTGLQQANANDMAVLYPYRGNLCAWNANCFQMWQTDPDPTQMALLDQMDGIGSMHPLAARAVGNELYFLANQGIRSVGIANAAQNLQAGDVGMPIDLLVQAAMVQWAIDGKKALSTYWPGMGQYWICGADDGETAGAGGALRLICAPPGGEVGDAYTYTYTATGGTAPYTFSVVSGTLPDGLTLDEDTGVLSGTLEEAGTFSFGVQVTDALGVVAYCGWSAEVVEDEVEVTAGDLLVTGSDVTPGGPLMAKAKAIATPVFTGILQSTGATIEAGVPAYRSDSWVVHGMGSDENAIISTDLFASWSALPTDRASFGYIAPGPGGWLNLGAGPVDAYDLTAKASPIALGFSSYAFAAEYPPGTPALTHGEEAYMCRYAGGYYWIDTGPQGYLVKTTNLSLTTQQLVYKRPGAEHIFLDIEVLGSTVYAATAAGKVIASADGGATWPTTILSIGAGAGMPLYLKAGNGKLLILSRDSATVWTSADSFATGHATGISGDATASPPVTARFSRGSMLEFASNRFFIVSPPNGSTPSLGNKCVTTANGLTFGTPVSTGLDGVTGIASNNPVT